MHRESENIYDVDIYDGTKLMNFLKDMDPDNKEWLDWLEGCTHIQKLEILDTTGFESLEIEVTEDEEKKEFEKKKA